MRWITRLVLLVLMASALSACSQQESTPIITQQQLDEVIERGERFKRGELEELQTDPQTLDRIRRIINAQVGQVIQQSPESPELLLSCKLSAQIGCAGLIIAAVGVCGGPEDVPCIAAALGATSSCLKCLGL